MIRNVESPLVVGGSSTLVKEVSVSKIKSLYKSYDLDVSSFFNHFDKIGIYECAHTGYQFYYPLDISGDSKFYEHFQLFPWYYMPWKWEHEISLSYITDGQSILEVGAAHGSFLKKISEKFSLKQVVGLELNESAEIINSKWSIIRQSVEEYSNFHKEEFDIVCSYQVLEHISSVYSFLNAKLTTLKKGGKLIISVPNNDSFIKNLTSGLNMPPHHMGLWNERSLLKLSSVFPVKLVSIHFEPLQDYHIDGYLNVNILRKWPLLLRKILFRFFIFSSIYRKMKDNIYENKFNIIGHTVLVVFEKI